jgi:magnesium chelatase accessory protein
MSNDIAALCYAQEWHPKMVIGHSAGGAIALDVVRHLSGNPVVVGVNAALENFDGLASWLFPVLARVLAVTPFAAQTLSAGGPNPHRAKRLLESTGSRLDDEGIGYYARLLADAGHVDGTLNMMAQWDIGPLIDRLEQITNPCLLLTGERDRAVNPRASIQACKKLARAEHRSLADLGHLAQEENPEAVLLDITRWIAATETVR